MKLKALLIGSIICLTTFLIYLTTLDKLVYFLALGDSLAKGTTSYGGKDHSYNDYLCNYIIKKNILEKYIKEFIEEDYRTTDLIRDIEDNRAVIINNKKQTIKNALIKADLVTLSIGMNDLYYKVNTINLETEDIYNHIEEMMKDIDKLFSLLRKYCKEDIVILNYFKTSSLLDNDKIEEIFNYANTLLKEKSNKYKIYYLETNKILEDNPLYLPQSNSYLPSRNGHEAISQDLIKIINKTLLIK